MMLRSAAVNHPHTVRGAEGVDGTGGGGDCEEGDGGEPEIHAEGLAGAGAGDCAERWVGGPARDGGSARDEGGAEKGDEGQGREPEAGGVEAGEGHGAGADLGGEDEVAEAGLWRSGEDEEQHDRAVDGDQREVVFGEDGAVKRKGPIGPDQMDAHQQREEGADDDGDEREDEVLDSDGAVIGGEDAGEYGLRG
jgi:hypothetical protein